MRPITIAHLEAKIDTLNKMWDRHTPCGGGFMLSQQYGGVELHRLYNEETGAVTAPLHTGHVPKRELAGLLDAMMTTIHLLTHEQSPSKTFNKES